MFPLSPAQQRLWLLNRLKGSSAEPNIPVTVRLYGSLNVAALKSALLDVVGRHTILRTVFSEHEGVPWFRVLEVREVDLELEVVEADRDDVHAALLDFAMAPFDLAGTRPPMRGRLLRICEDEYILALVFHRIVFDEWSVGPLLRDVGSAYRVRLTGDAPDWGSRPTSARHDPGEPAGPQLDAWRDVLADLPENLQLPFDRPRSAIADHRVGHTDLYIAPELRAGMADLAEQIGGTPFTVVLAALAALLSRLGAGTDIPVGTTVPGRVDPGSDGLIGPLSNTLVLRCDTSGDPAFRELAQRVQETVLDAHSRRSLPFAAVVQELSPPRLYGPHPLFQIGLELRDEVSAPRFADLSTVIEHVDMPVSPLDLSIVLHERTAEPEEAPQGIRGSLGYATTLFDEGTASALAERLVSLLATVVKKPETPLSAVDVLTVDEHEKFERWNDTATQLPDLTVMEIFENQVARTPDAVALVAGEVRLSYAELNRWANRLAHHLLSLAVTPDTPVAVVLPRTAEAVVAWLAVVKSSGVYMPVDPANPAVRIRTILADARPAVLITTEAIAADLGPREKLPVLVTEHLQSARPEHDPTDADRPFPLLLDHAAYVIYTSGSTGRPKGVTVLHRALTNLWTYHSRITFPCPDGPASRRRVALSASLAFDTSWEGVLAMIAGHELHLLDELTRRDPGHLVGYVAAHGINQLDVTPSFAQQLLTEGILATDPAPHMLMLGGEAVSEALWDELSNAPDTTVFNYYGPSEFCVEASGCTLREHGSSTIGRPVFNTQVYVLDDHLNPVPPGVQGEIYLAGTNLGRGYLGQPARTAERFVANPFGGYGARMYRSGDLGRWTSDGFLLYTGRSDNMVKLRGIRIELGDIQTAITRHGNITDIAVVVREDVPGNKCVVAYIVPSKGQSIDVYKLRTDLAKELPDYLVPAAFVILDALPLTQNAKLDHSALPAPNYQAGAEGRAPQAPRERQIARIFSEVLKVDSVSIDDNFFDMGGNSLMAMSLIYRIRTDLGLDINLLELVGHPTVAGVVESLRAEHREGGE